MTMTRRRYSSMTRRSRAFVLRCILSLVDPRRGTRSSTRRAPARASSASASASSGDSSRTASPSSAYCRGGAPGLCSHRGSRRAPVDVRAEDSEGAAAVARGRCANDGAVGDARDVPADARPPTPSPPVPSRASPRPALSSPRPLGPSASAAAGVAFPAPPETPAAPPLTLARHGRARRRWMRARGPAPRDGRRGRGFASGSRARAPPARGRVRARAGSPVAMQARSGRRAADVPARDGVRHAGVLRGPTHTRFLGWRVDQYHACFFSSVQAAGIEYKKNAFPSSTRAAMRTTSRAAPDL